MTAKTGDADKFIAMLNPEKFSHSHSITYEQQNKCDPKPVGNPGTTTKFKNVSPETIDFSIILDGTGVIREIPLKLIPTKVNERLKKLKEIVYTYDGTNHEPNVVQLLWGEAVKSFNGRLTSMKVDYTLFSPVGEPLRATVAMSFVSFDTQGGVAAKAAKSSPDMTHLVTVRAGDTLPLLCQQIYGDVSRYAEVAAFNKLDGFRTLTPGQELYFPPIR